MWRIHAFDGLHKSGEPEAGRGWGGAVLYFFSRSIMQIAECGEDCSGMEHSNSLSANLVDSVQTWNVSAGVVICRRAMNGLIRRGACGITRDELLEGGGMGFGRSSMSGSSRRGAVNPPALCTN